MSGRPRILVEPNAHHLRNLGDVAMLQVAVGRLQTLWPEGSVAIITDDPSRLARCCPAARPVPAAGRRLWFDSHPFTYTLQRVAPRRLSLRLLESERVVQRNVPGVARRLVQVRAALGRKDARSLDEFLDAVDAADIVVSSGAGAFNDEFASLAITILDLLQMAKDSGAVTALLGHGVGPITDRGLLHRAREVLPEIDFLTLRERVVGEPLLTSLGVPSDRIIVTGDDAIELAYEARRSDTVGHLGFSLRMARYAHVNSRSANEIGAVVRAAATRHGCRLLSLPISHHPFEADAAVNARVLGAPGEVDGEVETPLEIIERVGRCRAVVTGSYHAAVFALAQGIPAVGLTASAYYDAKFAGLQDQFGGYGLWIVRLTDPDLPGSLASSVDEAWAEADKARPHLLEHAMRQVESGRGAYRRLGELVAAGATGIP